ncbi:MAG TPA: hypothetical protein VKL21_08605 [Candidatus Methanoperedens sp.]|nr:hypothetical protein [Candidatus Methanoperedens sp.]
MEDIEMVLEINGTKIPMNGFVKKILCGMVKGSIETLHGVGDDWKDVNIRMSR